MINIVVSYDMRCVDGWMSYVKKKKKEKNEERGASSSPEKRVLPLNSLAEDGDQCQTV